MKPYSLQSFMDASKENLCLYIEGDPKYPPATICALYRAAESSYCALHEELCHTPTSRLDLSRLAKL